MHAEVISIGDEIISGQLLDTNCQWLSQRLEELGVRVLYHSAVGDELEAMVGVFRLAIGRADVIVTTGGLGPTADDLTREALAQATGRKLVLDARALEQIRALFARRKREMPKRNESQAMFPEGSRVVPNPHGTAPGIDLEIARPGLAPCRLFALPGVPDEMKEMWLGTVAPELRKAGAGRQVIRHRRIKCFGAGESQMEAMLPDVVRRGREPRVGINASQATIIFRVTAAGPTEQAALAAMEPTLHTIRKCLGNLVFGEEDDELQDAVVRLLRQRQQTLATVEWGTAGLVADWLGSAAQGDPCYRGGLVLGAEATVQQVLGAGPDVSAMAEACRKRFGADYGLCAGPFPTLDPPPAEPKPFHYALAGPGGVTARAIPFAAHPALLKVLCAKHVLNLARLAMLA